MVMTNSTYALPKLPNCTHAAAMDQFSSDLQIMVRCGLGIGLSGTCGLLSLSLEM